MALDVEEPDITYSAAMVSEVAMAARWRWPPSEVQQMSVSEVREYMGILSHLLDAEAEQIEKLKSEGK